MFSWFMKRSRILHRKTICEVLEERIVLDAAQADASDQQNQDDTAQSSEHNTSDGTVQPSDSQWSGTTQETSDPVGDIQNQDLSDVLVSNALDEITQSVGETGQGTDVSRILLISSSIEDAQSVADSVGDDVLAILYDGSSTTLAELLAAIGDALGENKVTSIGFVTHSLGEGQFHLAGGCTVSLSTILGNSELQAFWQNVGNYVEDGGRIDLFACALASTQTGQLLISQLENITGHDVAASDDTTGSAAHGGDWILETDGIDLVSMYFAGTTPQGADLELAAEYKVTASDAAAHDQFGNSVSISGDYAIVGAPYDDDGGYDLGSAYIFRWDGNNWVEQAKLTASDAAPYDYFGSSVSISGDYAFVGSACDDDLGFNSGSVYIFHWDGNNWVEQGKIYASDAEPVDNFGNSVCISGDYAIVGAHQNDDGGYNSGSAYVFHWDGNNWVEQGKIYASDAEARDNFGHSVSISGNYAIVGVDDNPFSAPGSGSAYIFHWNGNEWVQQEKLTASNPVAMDYFGYSVSISGEYAIVGAWGDDDQGFYTGSAYIFHRDGNNWVLQSELTASDAESRNYFGYSVSISGDYVIVGAWGDDDGGDYSGSAYIFHWDGNGWVQQEKLVASDPAADDFFGQSVSISGGNVIVGADGDDDGGDYSGSAYIFSWNTAPTSSGIADVTVDEDAANTVFSLYPSFADAEDSDAQLTYTVVGNTNPGLFTNVDISDPTNFILDYAPDANGTAVITIRATDTDDLWVEDTFTVTINAVTDPWETPPWVNLDDGLTTQSEQSEPFVSTVGPRPDLGDPSLGDLRESVPDDLSTSKRAEDSKPASQRSRPWLFDDLLGKAPVDRHGGWNDLFHFFDQDRHSRLSDIWLGLKDFMARVKESYYGQETEDVRLVFNADEIELAKCLDSLTAKTEVAGGDNSDIVSSLSGHTRETTSDLALIFNPDEMRVFDMLVSDQMTKLWNGARAPIDSSPRPVPMLHESNGIGLTDLLEKV